jgi:hypothetical protein
MTLLPRRLPRPIVVLMPAVEFARMPAATADLIFCSHLLSDIASDAMAEYLGQVARIASDFFLFVGSRRAGKSISRWFNRNDKAVDWRKYMIRHGVCIVPRIGMRWSAFTALWEQLGAAKIQNSSRDELCKPSGEFVAQFVKSFGDTLLPHGVTLGFVEPQREVAVWLHGLDTPLDVTHRHSMACAAPFTICLAFDEKQRPNEQELRRLSLSFCERGAKAIVG